MIFNYPKSSNSKCDKRGNVYLLEARKEELRDLAKGPSSSLFIFEFIKTFPAFMTAIRMRFSTINSMDLKFCALLKLGFSTAEIAEITASSLRAVESRKFRIRKRFELASHVDLGGFIAKFGEDNENMEKLPSWAELPIQSA